MKYDQFIPLSKQEEELHKVHELLCELTLILVDKNGNDRFASLVKSIPKSLTAKLSEEDKEIMRQHTSILKQQTAAVQELSKLLAENTKTNKQWFWWVVGSVFVAQLFMCAAIYVLLR